MLKGRFHCDVDLIMIIKVYIVFKLLFEPCNEHFHAYINHPMCMLIKRSCRGKLGFGPGLFTTSFVAGGNDIKFCQKKLFE